MKKTLNKMRLCILLFLSLFMGVNILAQDTNKEAITVKGRAVDLASQMEFAGVRVSVIGTRITAMSDENGMFEIQVPALDVTLSVDAPGYENQIVSLKGRTEITIFMLRKTGAASFYDNTEFSTSGQTSVADFSKHILTIDEDLTARLGGQVRSIIHSGTPASGSAVFARGFNSLNASSQPLYVVDGIVWQSHDGGGSINEGFYNNPLAVIDPKDVEKITVLKGGSSIYGSKGANGVILIDTKRSRSQATTITVDMGTGYRSSFQTIPVMNADEYLLFASDIIGGKYDNVTAINKYKFLENDPSKSYYKANHNNTDWLSLLNKGALSQNYGINVQGGDDVALYAISVGYVTSDGNVEDTNFDRFNFRINSDISMSDQLKLAFDIAFTQTSNNLRGDGINEANSPVYLSLIKSPMYSPYDYDIYGNLSNRISNYDELGVGNPWSLIKQGIGVSKQYALNTSVLPTYTFGKDKVKLGLLFSYGWRRLNENTFLPDAGMPELPLYNEQGEIYAVSRNFVNDRVDTHTSIIVDGYADWNILKNEINSFSAKGGYRFFTDVYKSHYAEGHNTGSDNIAQLANTQPNLRFSNGLDDSWRSMSWYGSADYSFKSKYLMNVSVAMDASSRFGEKAEDAVRLGGLSWGVFPSASAAWVISSESFMKDVDFINFLKLTAGYSLAGNDDIPNYESRTYFSSIPYLYSETGLILGNIGNPQLKWETTGMATVGLNLSMLNNRWNLKTEFYSSNTKDLLTRKQLNDVAGITHYWSNDGELKNTGFEVSSNVRILNTQKLKLDFSTSIGHYKNEITSLANGTFITDVAGAQILTQVGQPAGVFYGYKTNGVYATTEEAIAANLAIRDAAGNRIPFEAGDMRFEQVGEDDGVIDEKDRQIIGDPNPDFYGNFNFNLSWKEFTFGALFTYSYGNDVYNALRANLESGSSTNNQSTAMLGRWVANGQVTDIPRATYGDPMGNARFSDRWIEDGSYLKFKSISVDYKLPVKFSFLQGISVWGSVNNLFTLTKYLGGDPEFAYGNSVLYQGIDAGLVPQSRSYNLGVKIHF